MKKYLFVFYILFTNNFCFSQSCENLNQKVVNLYKSGKIKECFKLADEALIVCKKEYGDSSEGYSLSVSNIAFLYFESGNYIKALDNYLITISIELKLFGVTPVYLNSSNNYAFCLAQIGDYKRAEREYIGILDIVKQINGVPSIQYTDALRNLGRFYFNRREFKKSESYYLQVMERTRDSSGKKSAAYVLSLNKVIALFNSPVL